MVESSTFVVSAPPADTVGRAEWHAHREAQLPAFIGAARVLGAEWRLGVSTIAEFQAIVTAVGNGDRFRTVDVNRVLAPLVGGAMAVEITSGGPEIFFTLPHFPHQRKDQGWPGAQPRQEWIRYTPDERVAMARAVIDAARQVYADEITVEQYPSQDSVAHGGRTGKNPHRIRLWWD